MTCRSLPIVLLPALAVLACSAPPRDDAEALVSNLEEDGGAPDARGAQPPVAPFALSDVAGTARIRWALGDAPPVDGADAKVTIAISGTERRFVLHSTTPSPAGPILPAMHVEFGRGRAKIERGTYDCATTDAVAVVVKADRSKILTVVDGAPQRPCTVTIDEAAEVPPLPNEPLSLTRGARRVVGRFEATLGPRDDGAAATTQLRGAFAAYFHDR